MFDIVKNAISLLGFPQLLSGQFSGSGEGTLTSSADIIDALSADLSSESILTSNANITAFAGAVLSGNTDLSSAAVLGVQATAVMTSEASLNVTANVAWLSIAMSAGSSEFTATGVIGYVASSQPMAGSSDLSATGFISTTLTSDPLSGQSNLVATMFEPLNILVLPTVEYNYSNNRLMQFYGIDSGQSLIITGTTGTIVEFQTGTEIEAADYYFGGGRRHVLDDTEVTAVTNAGFGNLITIEGVPSGV
jgi:hypothetical protein